MVKIVSLQVVDYLAAVTAEVFIAKDMVEQPVGGAEGFGDGIAKTGGSQFKRGIDNDRRDSKYSQGRFGRDYGFNTFYSWSDIGGSETIHSCSGRNNSVRQVMFKGGPFSQVVDDAATDCKGNVDRRQPAIEPVMSGVIANRTAMISIRNNDMVYRPARLFEDLPGTLADDDPGPLVGYYENTASINKGF